MSSIRLRFPAALACAAALGSAGAVRAQPKPPAPGGAPAGQRDTPAGGAAAPEQPAQPQQLGDEAELARGANLYESGKYPQCAKDFAQLLDPDNPRALRDASIKETARVYYAACLIGSGQPDKAIQPLEDAIRDNPQMKAPDSTIFPQPVIDKFLQARQQMLDYIHEQEQQRIKAAQAKAQKAEKAEKKRRERIARLKELASEETIVTKNSRWLAAIPFGVGQFQNRQSALGWTFLTSETLLAGTAFGMIALQSQYAHQAFDVGKGPALRQNSATAQKVLYATGYGFLGVAVLGIVQAQIAYKPEFRDGVRKRKLPPDLQKVSRAPTITPGGGPLAGGGFTLGVTGRF